MSKTHIVGLVQISIQHELDFKEQYIIFVTIKAGMAQKEV
jgi:hypothetical protein